MPAAIVTSAFAEAEVEAAPVSPVRPSSPIRAAAIDADPQGRERPAIGEGDVDQPGVEIVAPGRDRGRVAGAVEILAPVEVGGVRDAVRQRRRQEQPAEVVPHRAGRRDRREIDGPLQPALGGRRAADRDEDERCRDDQDRDCEDRGQRLRPFGPQAGEQITAAAPGGQRDQRPREPLGPATAGATRLEACERPPGADRPQWRDPDLERRGRRPQLRSQQGDQRPVAAAVGLEQDRASRVRPRCEQRPEVAAIADGHHQVGREVLERLAERGGATVRIGGIGRRREAEPPAGGATQRLRGPACVLQLARRRTREDRPAWWPRLAAEIDEQRPDVGLGRCRRHPDRRRGGGEAPALAGGGAEKQPRRPAHHPDSGRA